MLTGHSQGGALANLLRAYLENLPDSLLSDKNQFKTIVFGAPMIGNKVFAEEYTQRFSNSMTSFNIINPADPVPKFPVSYKDSGFISDNLVALFSEKERIDMGKMLNDGFFLLFEDAISNSIKKFSHSASEQISKELGQVSLPEYLDDFNYRYLDARVEIPPVEYPKILKDSSILENDSLMAIYPRGEDGEFLNQELYKKEPWAFQHKPYNYYVSVLKKYFPEQYAVLNKKFLSENL
jgi:hypothetical protein